MEHKVLPKLKLMVEFYNTNFVHTEEKYGNEQKKIYKSKLQTHHSYLFTIFQTNNFRQMTFKNI